MGNDNNKTIRVTENQTALSELLEEKEEKEQSCYDFSLLVLSGQELIWRHNKNDFLDIFSAGSPKTTFFLTGTLLRHFYKLLSNKAEITPMPSPEDVYAALKNFYMEVSGQPNILDKAIPIDFMINDPIPQSIRDNTELYESTNFIIEVYNFIQAIRFWLHPIEGKKTIAMLFNNPSLTTKYTGFFSARCREFKSWPILHEGQFRPVYESKGILPLCWAEVWHAIDHKIKTGLCPYCWDVFTYPSNNYQKAHCGRNECKKAHIIKQHGGEEGYRKWESSRKIIPDIEKRKRGRPKKNTDNSKGGSN